jgi:hypothetical protein
MAFRWSSFRNVSDDPSRQPRWPPLLKIENSAKNHLKIISSETTGPIGPKLWRNGLQMVHFESCVRRSRPPTKIAAVSKNRKFGKKSLQNYLLWNYWANWVQTMVEWSLGGHLSELCPTTRLLTKMVSVTKNKIFSKKSLKNDFLWNCWASWAQTMMEWSSGDPLSEFCPTTLAASQDVRHY